MKCSIEGCQNPLIQSRKGVVRLCRAHADQVLNGPCAMAGCDRKVVSIASRMCVTHSRREANGVALDAPLRIPGRLCSVEGCGRKHNSGGFCYAHLRQIQRHGEIRPLRKKAPANSVKPFIAAVVAERDRGSCWQDWPFGRSDGRPTLRHEGRRVLVAPYVLWLTSDVWPVFACHTCDEGDCWNPDHLYHGDNATNANDRDVRRRSANQFGPWVRRDLRP